MVESSTTVKVTRSGHSKMLPLPAELARTARAELGDAYVVELVGLDLIYHRTTGAVTIEGTGAHRLGVVAPSRALPLTGRSSVPPLDDWEF